jgi:5'-nucleotidase
VPPLILLCNDDGHRAAGLKALRRELAAFAEVVVCAPERNQSAISHALTLHQVLRLRQVADQHFAVEGTPADAVYVALYPSSGVLERTPDLVVSGINRGPNLGVDVNYSGTVAAAREAALRGLAAVALSCDVEADLTAAAELGAAFVRAVLGELDSVGGGRDAPLLLNVNIPARPSGAVEVTTQGGRPYEIEILRRTDPRDREYLWLGSGSADDDPEAAADSDTRAFHAGAVTVTPLSIDLSARQQHPVCRRIIDRLDRTAATTD